MKTLALILALALSAQSQATPQAAWEDFSSSEGGFSVSLPAGAQARVTTTYTSFKTIYTHTVSSSDQDLNSFSVSWTAYEAGKFAKRPPEKLFDKVRDALLKVNEGRLIADTPAGIGGHPGRAFAYETPGKSVYRVRLYIVGDTFFQVMSETKEWSANRSDGERFLDSFRLLK